MIDLEKCFDWIKRPILYYKLLEMNIGGKIYKAIKALYTNNTAFVKVNNDVNTDWLDVPNGVRQGDPVSQNLFDIFINEFVKYLKSLKFGIDIG